MKSTINVLDGVIRITPCNPLDDAEMEALISHCQPVFDENYGTAYIVLINLGKSIRLSTGAVQIAKKLFEAYRHSIKEMVFIISDRGYAKIVELSLMRSSIRNFTIFMSEDEAERAIRATSA